MSMVWRKAQEIPVVWQGDVCVLGGGCTGVFAAIRAARMNAKVCIVERQNCFGGVATAGLVNVWHSMFDFDNKERIVSGLSQEVIERLVAERQCEIDNSRNASNRFNPLALIRLLDELVQSHGIKTFFHTMYAGAETEDGAVTTAYIQNKDGCSAIKASVFIDATGDGDLLRDLGVARYTHPLPQPPTSAFLLRGSTSNHLISWLVKEHGAEVGLEDDWGWYGDVPGLPGISFRADNHVFGLDLSRADDLTQAEFEGRRRAFALETLLTKYASPDFRIVNLCSSIGIRETVHYDTRYRANEHDLLTGVRYDDAILQGTYRVDIHHSDDNGITFKELNGDMLIEYGKDSPPIHGDWRIDAGLCGPYAPFYQIPFSLIVQKVSPNVIPAGRMMNADVGAFGALRVMINTNQLGEAAGTAAVLCLDKGVPVQALDGKDVRSALRAGGSAL